jgi:thymidylate synthase
MNNTDLEYQRLLRLILEKGKVKKNRTGVDTIGVFGAQARFNLAEGFPLLTTKKMAVKAITHELLWFIKGDTNIKYLVDNNCNIWNGDCYRKYKENYAKHPTVNDVNSDGTPFDKELFIHQIKTDANFAAKWGDLGQGTYGQMWRSFPYFTTEAGHQHEMYRLVEGKVDQLQKVINKLKTNPDDRRMIVSAWHPYWVDHCALPPCHCLFHFNTEELTLEERKQLYYKDGKYENWHKKGGLLFPAGESAFDDAGVPKRRLNCLLYQRSCDTFLGVPFNIASYGLLTSMVAHTVGMVAGEFVHTYGDLHIYSNHIEQCKEQLTRQPLALPKLWLNPEVKNLFDFTINDIRIEDYNSHPAIKGEVSVG